MQIKRQKAAAEALSQKPGFGANGISDFRQGEKPSVFLGHGLRPITSNEKKPRLMQAWAKLFIFDVAWLMAIA